MMKQPHYPSTKSLRQEIDNTSTSESVTKSVISTRKALQHKYQNVLKDAHGLRGFNTARGRESTSGSGMTRERSRGELAAEKHIQRLSTSRKRLSSRGQLNAQQQQLDSLKKKVITGSTLSRCGSRTSMLSGTSQGNLSNRNSNKSIGMRSRTERNKSQCFVQTTSVPQEPINRMTPQVNKDTLVYDKQPTEFQAQISELLVKDKENIEAKVIESPPPRDLIERAEIVQKQSPQKKTQVFEPVENLYQVETQILKQKESPKPTSQKRSSQSPVVKKDKIYKATHNQEGIFNIQITNNSFKSMAISKKQENYLNSPVSCLGEDASESIYDTRQPPNAQQLDTEKMSQYGKKIMRSSPKKSKDKSRQLKKQQMEDRILDHAMMNIYPTFLVLKECLQKGHIKDAETVVYCIDKLKKLEISDTKATIPSLEIAYYGILLVLYKHESLENLESFVAQGAMDCVKQMLKDKNQSFERFLIGYMNLILGLPIMHGEEKSEWNYKVLTLVPAEETYMPVFDQILQNMRNSELDQQKMAHILLQKLIQKNAEVYDPQTTHMISEVEAMIL